MIDEQLGAWKGEDFKSWQARLGLTNEGAATELGTSLTTIKNFRSATELSKMTELSCNELERRFRSSGARERWEVQIFSKNGGVPVARPAVHRRFADALVGALGTQARNPKHIVRVRPPEIADAIEIEALRRLKFILP